MSSLLLAALLASASADADLTGRFRELHEKGDRETCAALWREERSSVLPTIEKELDLALALRENAKAEDAAAALAFEERAVWGARIARETLGTPLIADLACARAAWSEADRRLYREERAVHAKAVAWIEKGENRWGLEAALETVSRALALADWRGAAMGYQTAAIAHQALSSFDDALVAWNQARMTYRELSLQDEELACLRAVLDMCHASERFARGLEAADQAVALARERGDRKAQAELLERRATFEEKLGLSKQAETTRGEAKALGR